MLESRRALPDGVLLRRSLLTDDERDWLSPLLRAFINDALRRAAVLPRLAERSAEAVASLGPETSRALDVLGVEGVVSVLVRPEEAPRVREGDEAGVLLARLPARDDRFFLASCTAESRNLWCILARLRRSMASFSLARRSVSLLSCSSDPFDPRFLPERLPRFNLCGVISFMVVTLFLALLLLLRAFFILSSLTRGVDLVFFLVFPADSVAVSFGLTLALSFLSALLPSPFFLL